MGAVPDLLLVNLANGWELRTEELSNPALAFEHSIANIDPYQAWLDAGEIKLPMIVRCRNAGERFQPLGMQGHSMKVSDLMINSSFPKGTPDLAFGLLRCGNSVDPGFRLSHLAQVKPDSRMVVHLSLRKLPTG